jgi:RNA polymerase sigma-70 factor (ECF subfamily)
VFATTHWSLVLAAGGESPAAREALAELCRLYWYPLYAYIRRHGHDADEAQDLTQEFFALLLARDDLAGLDPARGRFRAFLLGACRHFLANQRDRAQALKRGGGRRPLSLDLTGADGRYAAEPSHEQPPERLFERRWALTLLDQVMQRLRRYYEAAGQSALFERLKGTLTGDAEGSYAETAAALDMTEGAVKVAAHRMRQRYRDLLREEIARTVADPAEVDDEVRTLFRALRSLSWRPLAPAAALPCRPTRRKVFAPAVCSLPASAPRSRTRRRRRTVLTIWKPCSTAGCPITSFTI